MDLLRAWCDGACALVLESVGQCLSVLAADRPMSSELELIQLLIKPTQRPAFLLHYNTYFCHHVSQVKGKGPMGVHL